MLAVLGRDVKRELHFCASIHPVFFFRFLTHNFAQTLGHYQFLFGRRKLPAVVFMYAYLSTQRLRLIFQYFLLLLSLVQLNEHGQTCDLIREYTTLYLPFQPDHYVPMCLKVHNEYCITKTK